MPRSTEGDVIQRRDDGRTDEAGEAGQVLGQDRVALMGHGRAALLAGVEGLFGFQHFGPLQVADLDGQTLDAAGDHGQGREPGGVAVARDDLGRDRLDDEAEFRGDVFLDARIDVGEGPDGAGDGAGGDLEAGHGEAFFRPHKLGVVASQLEAKGGRLGMDAVAAAGAGGELVFQGPALEGGQHQVDVLEEEVGGLDHLHRQAGVEHVAAGHALVQESGFGADDLGHVGQEGDDVVLGGALDLVDAVGVPDLVLATGPDGLGGFLGDDAQFGHGVSGVRLDLEPDLIAGLRRPDGGRFGA